MWNPKQFFIYFKYEDAFYLSQQQLELAYELELDLRDLMGRGRKWLLISMQGNLNAGVPLIVQITPVLLIYG